ncbi:MAG TPA: CPBP family glutamic-type intramembrane protease [Vicinamibacterales bacterium]
MTKHTSGAFYYFAVGPLYLARGFDRSVLIGTVAFETIRWGVLAFVLSRLAVRLQDAGVTSGFALRQNLKRAPSLLGIGIAVGVVVTVILYGLSLIEYRVGYLNVLPWPVANGEALDVRLVAGGGVRNLVGEEVFARLGAQSIALSLLQRMRARAALAVILSSLYFEIWHNPFEVPQFLNFAASCVLAWAYHKFGYEVAAVAHCVADWLALGFLPAILFR